MQRPGRQWKSQLRWKERYGLLCVIVGCWATMWLGTPHAEPPKKAGRQAEKRDKLRRGAKRRVRRRARRTRRKRRRRQRIARRGGRAKLRRRKRRGRRGRRLRRGRRGRRRGRVRRERIVREPALLGWRARQTFHRKEMVIDLHADSLMHLSRRWYDLRRWHPFRALDIPKLRRGGVDAQVFVMYVPYETIRRPGSGWAYLKKMHRTYRRILRTYPDVFEHVQTYDELMAARRRGKIGAMLAIEGLHGLMGNMKHARIMASWRMFYVGFTWNDSNAFATAARDEAWNCPKIWPSLLWNRRRLRRMKRRRLLSERRRRLRERRRARRRYGVRRRYRVRRGRARGPAGRTRRSRQRRAKKRVRRFLDPGVRVKIPGRGAAVRPRMHRRTSPFFAGCGKGLSEKGRALLRILEDAGTMFDVSHASRTTFWEVMRLARLPVIASHSDAFSVRRHYRNLTDRQLRALRKTGGVVGVNFFTHFIHRGRQHRKAGIPILIDHIDHIARIAGYDAVALGSDYDGGISAPQKLRHFGHLPRLTYGMVRRGWTRPQIRAFLGQNILRVMKRVQQVRRSWRR